MSYKTLEPALVGSYPHGTRRDFLPVSPAELGRTQYAIERVLRSLDLGVGRFVLLISLLENGAYAMPFERAIMNLGLLCTNADNSRYEAQRIESICRRFDVTAIAGVTGEVLDGLAEAGHALDTLFGGRVVWAHLDAYDRLKAVPRIVLRRVAEVGPALALECSEGQGLHIDSNEWDLQEAEGAILLTSRLLRSANFYRHPVLVEARLVSQPCGCGNGDLRIEFN
jgi:hypothetical protein